MSSVNENRTCGVLPMRHHGRAVSTDDLNQQRDHATFNEKFKTDNNNNNTSNMQFRTLTGPTAAT